MITGPVIVLFDLLDQVPTMSGAVIPCAADKAALATNTEARGKNIVQQCILID
jgi:hypothetical protein